MTDTKGTHMSRRAAVWTAVAFAALGVSALGGRGRDAPSAYDQTASTLSAAQPTLGAMQPALAALRPLSRPVKAPREPASAARVALGRRIFFDADLSEPRGTSCASCHEPALAFAGVNGSKIGVARGSRPDHYARRNTPSLLYLKYVRPFYFHAEEDTQVPEARGGFFWDGRVNSIADLVRQPLLDPDEMNNADVTVVVNKLRRSAYAAELRNEFGARVDTTEGAMTALGAALEAFLLSDDMAPFSSKYDEYLRGRAQLAPIEARGLALFDNPVRGNCSSCHFMTVKLPNPERSLFSNFGYEAVAPPRNRRLPVNADSSAFDLGLCERKVPGASDDPGRFCASFRTPSLRNVALRPSFMHNGVFTKLRDVVAFYATRGTDPARWYRGHAPFDDLPAEHRDRINTQEVPYDRGLGMAPRLDDADIDAIVAFLGTLTDQRLPSPASASAPPARPARPPRSARP